MYCRLCVWHSLLIEITNSQVLWENTLVVILDGNHMLTEKPKGYLIKPKSLIRRHFILINGYVCDAIIWINNISFLKKNYIWIWIFLYKISFSYIPYYIMSQSLDLVFVYGIISQFKDNWNKQEIYYQNYRLHMQPLWLINVSFFNIVLFFYNFKV